MQESRALASKPMIEGRQLRAARALLGWTVDDLARHSELGRATVQRAEGGAATIPANAERLRQAFEKAGIEFLPNAFDRGVGVRMVHPDTGAAPKD